MTQPFLKQTHVAFQKGRNLGLHNLCLSEQTFVYGLLLQASCSLPNPVYPCFSVCLGSRQQVGVVVPDIAPLDLD